MGHWTPKEITRVYRVIASSTRPMHVATDQGEAFIKLPDNPEGPPALVCELIGTRVAEWLGLPTFDVALVNAAALPLPESEAPQTHSKPGLAFVARKVPGQVWGGDAEQLAACENQDALAGLVVLDTWLRNPDRHSLRLGHKRNNVRNVFFGYEGAAPGRLRLIAMDFTEALRCGGSSISRDSLSLDSVRDGSIYGLFPEFVPYVSSERVRELLDRIRAFSRQDGARIVQEVPMAWDLSSQLRERIPEFLADRAAYMPELSSRFADALAAAPGQALAMEDK